MREVRRREHPRVLHVIPEPKCKSLCRARMRSWTVQRVSRVHGNACPIRFCLEFMASSSTTVQKHAHWKMVHEGAKHRFNVLHYCSMVANVAAIQQSLC